MHIAVDGRMRNGTKARWAFLSVAATMFIGCEKRPPELDAKPEYLSSSSGKQYLNIAIKTAPHADVTCKPKCSGLSANDSGETTVEIRLENAPGSVPIDVTATAPGLFGASRTVHLDYQYAPNVEVRTKDDEISLECFVEACEGKVKLDDESIEIHGAKLAKVTVADEAPVVAGADHSVKIHAQSVRWVADMSLRVLATPGRRDKVKVPLELAFDDGTIIKTELSGDLYFNRPLADLRDISKAPVRFAGEPEPTRAVPPKPGTVAPPIPKPSSLLVVDDQIAKAYGPAQKLRDVDAIAVRTWKLREIQCGAYTDKEGKVYNVKAQAQDDDYVVYDRRTGTEIAKRHFVAPSGCPDQFSSQGDPTQDLMSIPDEAAVDAWLGSLLDTAAKRPAASG